MVQATLAGRNNESMKPRTAQVGQVAITLERMQAAAKKATSPYPEDEIVEALVVRRPSMFMDAGEECWTRVEEF